METKPFSVRSIISDSFLKMISVAVISLVVVGFLNTAFRNAITFFDGQLLTTIKRIFQERWGI